MRILIHGINYFPELIGIGRYTGDLAAGLAARGHRVTVLTAPPYYPHWRVQEPYRRRGWLREVIQGVEVLRAPLYVPSRPTGPRRLLHDLSFGVACLPWWPALLRRPWDVALAVCPPLVTGPAMLALATARGLPFAFHYQDLQVDAARQLGLLGGGPLFAFLELLERLLLRRAAAVTTISRGMAARLQDKGVPPARLHLLPNWADLETIRPLPPDNPLRDRWRLPGRTTVLYAGNLGEKQGLETLLDCARRLRDRPDLAFLIAGAGAARERLQAAAVREGLDNVRFLPLQSQEDFPLLLAAGDLHLVVQQAGAADLVMPSKLANIMAAGRPFVATADPASELGRITRESGAGLLTPPGDAAALSAAVRELAADPSRRRLLGDRGRRYAETHLRRQTLLDRWEALLAGLAGRQDNFAGPYDLRL